MSQELVLAVAAAFLCSSATGAQEREAPSVPPTQELSSQRWGDFDSDGLEDLFVTSAEARVRLLRNLGDGRFADVTPEVGLDAVESLAARPGRFDGDPWLDLLVVSPGGALRLFQGSRTGLFFEVTSGSGLERLPAVTGAGTEWIDYDRDGWFDLSVEPRSGALFVLRNVDGIGFERVDLGTEALREPGSGPLVPATGAATETPEAAPPAVARANPAKTSLRPGGRRLVVPDVSIAGRQELSLPTPPQTRDVDPIPLPDPCADSIRDASAPGNCLLASSVGTIGQLYPLSVDFHVTPAGWIGMGVLVPQSRLHLADGDLRISDGSLNLFDAGTRTLSLDARDAGEGGGGSRLRMFNGSGLPTIELDADEGGTGFSTLRMRNDAGRNTVTIDSGTEDGGGDILLANSSGDTTIFMDSESGIGSTYNGYNDAGVETIEIASDVLGSGRVNIRNENGGTRVALSGGILDDGGDVLISAADGSATVFLDGEAQNGGGLVSVRNDLGQTTVELIGDTSNGNSGQLSMYDRTNGVNSVVLNGRDSAGTGSELILRGPSGNSGIDLDASNGGVAELALFEDDGSRAFRFQGNLLNLYDSNGTSTISFNRQTGAKNAVVTTESYGQRLLYAIEATEVWFEDMGTGRLRNGRARIQLDPIFLETVTIDGQHPLQVYVTPTADCAGLFVEKGRDGFTLVERDGGKSNATFDWRVAAKRRGLEDARLELFEESAEATTEGR